MALNRPRFSMEWAFPPEEVCSKVFRKSKKQNIEWADYVSLRPGLVVGHYYLPHTPKSKDQNEYLEHYLYYYNLTMVKVKYDLLEEEVSVTNGSYKLRPYVQEKDGTYTFRVPANSHG